MTKLIIIKSVQMSIFIDYLPSEIFIEILYRMEPNSIKSIILVNRDMETFLNNYENF